MAGNHRVLVTGASGFVGRAVAEFLTACGWEVHGVSRSEGIRMDVAAPDFAEEVAAIVPACDAIVHAAAAISKEPDGFEVTRVNCVGTQQVFHLARLWGVQSVVYLSSIQVIGLPETLPVTEEHPVFPRTAYHASKLFGEHLLALLASDGINAATLRMTSPIGSGAPLGRIFAEFVRSASLGRPLVLAGTGTRKQDFVDVRDIAAAVALCLERGAAGTFNLATGRPVSNRCLAETCIRTLLSASEIAFSGVDDPEEGLQWLVSSAKLEALGWRPRYSLEDSIRRTVGALAPSLDQ